MQSHWNYRGRMALALLVTLALLVATLPLPVTAGAPAAMPQPSALLAPLANEQVRGELNSWGGWSMTASFGGTFMTLLKEL